MESNPQQNKPSSASPIPQAISYSRYLERLCQAHAGLSNHLRLDQWSQPFLAADMRQYLDAATVNDSHSLGIRLRELRQQVMARLIVRDLSNLASLDEVMTTITIFAEIAIQSALHRLQQELSLLHGQPRGLSAGEPQQLHVIAMGKLGGSELNVSSDIDLVFIYPEDGDTDGARSISNHEYFTRLTRQLIGMLSERTAQDYVFRVDTRLRPYGDSGPLVASFDMLENYFITQGRTWERYAWIKARPLSGDQQATLLNIIKPFVYRRHLDYAGIAAIRTLHQQIRDEVKRHDRYDHIKLGPGGIREIEFIVQVFQLIRGGHERQLQVYGTRPMLDIIAERQLLPETNCSALQSAYLFLRQVEHRLQYRDDQQTHSLPTNTDELDRLAQSLGFDTATAFKQTLDTHRDQVTQQFNAIFADTDEAPHPLAFLWTEPIADTGTATATLNQLGFRESAELWRQISTLRQSSRYRQLPASSQHRLDHLIPVAIATAATCANPDRTAERLLNLFEQISRREAYLALLHEYPQALARVADLMSASAWVAQYISRYPILLDELLDGRTLMQAPDWQSLGDHLKMELHAAENDIERQMDVLRHFKHTQTLHCVAQDLAGTLSLETLSDQLSDLAHTILKIVLEQAWQGLAQTHRPDPQFAIVAYGKLGGKELGYASDLDLVFIYQDDHPDAPERYARLTQRINNWLSNTTAAGVLYETDLRLRPEGNSGLLVSSLASFEQYQLHQAWTWEHQALTRARAVAGEAAICQRFEVLRSQILRQQRELPPLRTQILEMRTTMHKAHPNTSGLFDLKHDSGGIIDVEFIVQFLILGYSWQYPELTRNAGNIALLRIGASTGLIAPELASQVANAYRQYRQCQHQCRLAGDRYARTAASPLATAINAVQTLWQVLLQPSNTANKKEI